MVDTKRLAVFFDVIEPELYRRLPSFPRVILSQAAGRDNSPQCPLSPQGQNEVMSPTERSLAMTALVAALALPLTACRGSSSPAEAEISGRVLYATNGCGACHGQEGKGDGPIAKTLKPPPRDFRDGAAFKNGVAPAAIAKTIAEGLTRDGGQMQSYAHLTENERIRLAEYVISLRETPAQGADHATSPKIP